MENNLVQQQEQQQQGPKKKLSRTPSSLLRSPTVKSGIDSLSSLAEAAGGGGDESGEGSNSKNKKFCKSKSYTGAAAGTVNRPVAYSSLGNVYYSKTSKAAAPLLSRLRLRAQVMAAPMVLFLVPVVWYYTRGPMLDVLVLGLLFDFLSALAFVAALLISMRMAFSETRLGLRLRLLPPRLAHAAGAVALKFLAFMGDHDKRHGPGGPVTWTIGSTPPPKPSAAAQGRREGVEVFSNGDVYEGEFHQGKCSGSGVYYYFVNGRYEGDWVDGKYDGYGVETWARGSRYRGQYRRGFRHGYGVYRFFTGDMYAGQWANGQSHGTGVQTCDDGSRFVGQFKAGVKHGLGYYHFRNGDTYAGEYFADKMHGFGVYNFANGHRYEGAWHEGKRQGLGMYTFRNGETQSGYWHQGVLQRPSTLNSQIGFIKGVNHANILHAVQEARRAASKAFEVPRVDEKVNKAVAAANKAATAARVAAVKAVQKKIHGNVDAV